MRRPPQSAKRLKPLAFAIFNFTATKMPPRWSPCATSSSSKPSVSLTIPFAELNHWRDAIAQYGLSHLKGLVLETATAAPGGTGIANDWTFIKQCQQEGLFEGLPPMIAAGGLTPTTVAAVIRALQPWAVDVSSGVEVSRGIKSEAKILEFMEAVSREQGKK